MEIKDNSVIFVLLSLLIIGAAGQKQFEVRTFSATTIGAEGVAEIYLLSGWKLLGVGASTRYQSGANETYLTSFIVPDKTPSGQWHVIVNHRHNAYFSISPLVAYAIGIYDPANELDVQVFESAQSNFTHWPSASVTIPDGYSLTGGGADIRYSVNTYLTESYPDPTSSRTWVVRAKDHIVNSLSTISAWAIGVKSNNPKKLSFTSSAGKISATSEIVAHPTMTVTINPSAGQFLTGGGAKTEYVDYEHGGNLIWETAPVFDENGRGIGWSAASKDYDASDPAAITVYAIYAVIY